MKTLYTFLILLVAASAIAQKTAVAPTMTKALIGNSKGKNTGRDTVIESDTSKENKEPQYFYVTVSANAYVNTIGGFSKRFSPAIEIGRTYGIFDIGVATGRISFLNSGSDTTHYVELRPTINVFSKGRFAESFCLGIGGVFGAKQALMTEICNSINFNISENVGIAVAQGYCFFDGTNSNRSAQYFGFNLTYNFLKPHSVNKQRKRDAIISDK